MNTESYLQKDINRHLAQLKNYKFYCIGRYLETGDDYYKREKRRIDKTIRKELKLNDSRAD